MNVHTVVKILTRAAGTLSDLVCSRSVALLPLLPQTRSLIFTGQYSSWSHLHLSQDIYLQTRMQTRMWIVSAFVFARACQSMFACQHEPPAAIVVIFALQPLRRSAPSPLSVLVRRPHHRPPLFSLCLHPSHSVAHVQGTASCMSTRHTKSLFSTVGRVFVCANLRTHALFVTVSHYGGRDFLKWWMLLDWLIIFEIQIFLTVMQNQIGENQIIYLCPVRPPINRCPLFSEDTRNFLFW